MWIHLWFSIRSHHIISTVCHSCMSVWLSADVMFVSVEISARSCIYKATRPLQLHLQHSFQHGLWINLSWIIYCYASYNHYINKSIPKYEIWIQMQTKWAWIVVCIATVTSAFTTSYDCDSKHCRLAQDNNSGSYEVKWLCKTSPYNIN